VKAVAVSLGVLCLVMGLAVMQTPAQSQYQYPFQNPKLSIEERVTNIISLLTDDEKIDVLGANYYLGGGRGGPGPTLTRLGIRGYNQAEGLHGLARGRANSPNSIPTTTFPQAIGLGETWDPAILQKAAAVEGYEARWLYQNPRYARGGSASLIIRAPQADLGRDIRWGRNEEIFGEDAFMNGTLAAAFVRGLQGNDPKYYQTAALMKHFLANNNEVGRSRTSSDFDERLLREYYTVPFRMGAEAGARSYMTAYNAVNGIPMNVSPILRDITINEWGINEIIVTDAGDLEGTVRAHKYSPDLPTAAAQSVKAGVNQFLDGIYKDNVKIALQKNLLTMAEIEREIRGSFRTMIKLGLLDPPEMVPYSKIKEGNAPWVRDENKLLALQVTQEAIVLLKNQNDTLPLDKSKLKSIAVVGQRSNDVAWDWYSGAYPYAITPLDGIKKKVGAAVKVNFALNNDNNAAVDAAKASDVAIVVIGSHPTCGTFVYGGKCDPSEAKEGIDRTSIDLQAVQEQLIKDVFKANPKTIVVLKSSFPFAINWAQENVPAIVHMAHNSQEEGNALADVLFGDYNPAGRLNQTWVKSINDLPPMMDYNIRHGRTYMYFKGQPLYPFGYGLSYTTFAYSNLHTSAPRLAKDGKITVSVTVSNTGKRDGQEVVQLYVKHMGSKVERPIKELRGFERVALKAGETKTVQIPLAAKDLAYWDVQTKQWVVEDEKVNLMVGGSSADVKVQQTINVGS